MPNLCVQFPSTSWVSHLPPSMPHFSFYAFGIIGGRLAVGTHGLSTLKEYLWIGK